MVETVNVAIVGAGQAGLSLSYELTRAAIEHVVFERGSVGESWRRRWDSFRLVVPNWTVHLPGARYDGEDPDGFMPKDEIVSYLERYARSFGAPIQSGVDVTAIEPRDDGTFTVRTSNAEIRARQLVLASGGYQRAHRPVASRHMPVDSVLTIDAAGYTNPGALPEGDVLIVGSGQTGCQLAEECFEAGRNVYLACGRAPWVPRRIEGRDVLSWVLDSDFYETRLADLPSPSARLVSNPQFTGHGGGRDLNYRTLQALGVELVGRFAGVEDGRVHFADDLHASVAFGDARYVEIRDLLAANCAARAVPAPVMPDPNAFEADPPASIDLARVGAVVFTTGFRPDYTSWVAASNAFDDTGFPIQVDGSSTVLPGLHFMGVHFQRKRKSATLFGVAEDAAVLAEHMVPRR
ncbi:MAG: NAD(P)-binding domain-containing protein [Candidatus Dormiibacterota bacterium]